MKLKFRAEKKDVVAFLWACLLLLVVVAMCVKNFYNAANTGINGDTTGFSWTFNFIPALFPPYVGYTILFWILAIIVLTASVSSHFFTREKGFGFKEGKDEKGFGRFAKEYEYQEFEIQDKKVLRLHHRSGFPAGRHVQAARPGGRRARYGGIFPIPSHYFHDAGRQGALSSHGHL